MAHRCLHSENDTVGNVDGMAFRARVVAADSTPSKRLKQLSGFRSNTHRPIAEADVRCKDIRMLRFPKRLLDSHRWETLR